MGKTEPPPPPPPVAQETRTAGEPALPSRPVRKASETFAARLSSRQGARTAKSAPRLTGSDIVTAAISEAREQALSVLSEKGFVDQALVTDAHVDTLQEDKFLALFKDNPFGIPTPEEERSILTMMSQGDPTSPSFRLLRLQFVMTQLSQRMMLASNKLKSDADGNKDILNNVK